ncbi:MAG: threonyl-tRNA synthetase [Bathelium mastoideum]|nr:MAG: threonyl-tRNA synthetase [Bathelium mastoideum]
MEAAKDVVDGVKGAAEGVKNIAVSDKSRKPKKDKQKDAGGEAKRPLELQPRPEYLDHRLRIFDAVKARQDEQLAQKSREPINVTLDNGRIEIGQSWVTKPGDIARSISKSLYERTVISRVNGNLWDLERPLEESCRLELLDFEHPEGKKVFWHSSAHVLGEASERRYGCDLCNGPPIDSGFYYDMALPNSEVVQPSDWKPLVDIAQKAIKDKAPFERLIITKAELQEMFKNNKYKLHLIDQRVKDGESTTVYRSGVFIDLCRGPHVPNTGRIKTFDILRSSASYFLGDQNNDSVQRIYGISFPDKKQMEEHKKYLEEAAKRDHRRIGKDQELFFFHEFSPGSCFFLPHGTIIVNALMKFLRNEYWRRDYQEVQSPNAFNAELWKRSGHWQHYKDDMFTFEVEKDGWALKPMNCPGHCLVFGHRERSYRELPIRMAEFGVLHRNEASGALTGLTRVRRFVQDDTHIFCTEDQIEQEIGGLFDFLQTVYGRFGFTFKMKLSTRPDQFLGEIATWDLAEEKLTKALNGFAANGDASWELNPGDGAFYGPKIDITISDALKRDFQCATIQLDFQLPQQFNLEYREAEGSAGTKEKTEGETHQQGVDSVPGDKAVTGSDGAQEKVQYRKPLTAGCARPVMIHRAICGSFERFIAILTEHFAGKWPFWLSPRQVLVVPVMPAVNDYVLEVQKIFREKEMHVDVDISGNTMQKKIRSGQLQQYNFIFVVGAQEKESRTVNIRNRDDQSTQAKGELIPLDVALEKLSALRDKHEVLNAI